MPPKTSGNQNSQHRKPKDQFPTEFRSTKGRHVNGNAYVNDFSFVLDKQPESSSSSAKAKKAGKFVPRAQRVAANINSNKAKAA